MSYSRESVVRQTMIMRRYFSDTEWREVVAEIVRQSAIPCDRPPPAEIPMAVLLGLGVPIPGGASISITRQQVPPIEPVATLGPLDAEELRAAADEFREADMLGDALAGALGCRQGGKV